MSRSIYRKISNIDIQSNTVIFCGIGRSMNGWRLSTLRKRVFHNFKIVSSFFLNIGRIRYYFWDDAHVFIARTITRQTTRCRKARQEEGRYGHVVMGVYTFGTGQSCDEDICNFWNIYQCYKYISTDTFDN